MPRFLFFSILSVVFSTALHAQAFKGSVTDSAGNPLPFSTIYIKELAYGTSANQDGEFQLKLAPGNYTCIFQSMGYRKVTKNILVGKGTISLHVILPGLVYSLNEVVISSGGEDPANKIMRNVIANAPLHAGMVTEYTADVYIRGSMEIQQLSSMVKWMARDQLKEQGIKEGDTYLEESVNEIIFKAPNIVNQKVKSIHSTFPGNDQGGSSVAVGYISQNIYSPTAFGNAVSPLTAGAFSYYRYSYEGANQYGNVMVDKIKIIPNGDGPQYVSGYLYVIEGLWCIYTMDVNINSQLGTRIKINQTFGEVREGAWLAVNNRYTVDIEIMGNKSAINYYTSIKYNSIAINAEVAGESKANAERWLQGKKVVSKKARLQVSKIDEKLLRLSSSDSPTTAEANRISKLILRQKDIIRRDSLKNNHDYIERYKTEIDSAARTRDSSYWNQARPIPLSLAEKQGSMAFDSLHAGGNRQQNDSSRSSLHLSKKLLKALLTGGRYDPDTLKYFKSKGLLNPFGLNFNAVDGFAYKTDFGLYLKTKKQGLVSVSFSPGYAFSRKAMDWNAGIMYSDHGRLKQEFSITAGSGSTDFNPAGAMAIENSLSALLLHDNISRFYLRNYLVLNHSIRISHEMKLSSSLAFEDNRLETNNTDFSLLYSESRTYKANIPAVSSYSMADHGNLQFETTLTYRPVPYYYIKDGLKIPRPGLNNTPTFFAGYKKGIPSGGFKTNFDFIHSGLSQTLKSGLRSQLSYSLEAGYFASKKTSYFNEYKQFASQPYLLGIKSMYPVFQLLDYYSNSTNTGYCEGHLMYKTPMLLLKHLPLVRNRLWTESLSGNYLYIPSMGYRLELGYSIGNDFYQAGIYSGFSNAGFQSVAFRVTLSIFSSKQLSISF